MMKNRLYHNPRCSKSRETLALLQERQIDFETVLYLEHPPSVAALTEVVRLLGVEPLAIMRTKEGVFKELGLSHQDQRSAKEWLTLIHQHPILLERPILVYQGKAAVGRPPEAVLAIL